MNEIEKMTGMTDEEANAWDEYFTKNPPDVDAGKNRALPRRLRMVEVDDASADYLMSMAKSAHTTSAQIVGSLIREKIAVGV
ncbi:MAG: hypothetical protein LBS82_04240 [Spirochaetaceae bacterium]|jgi:hypothetical protein|nr:hypothetical protein [Spirochaetaceae bacterium]